MAYIFCNNSFQCFSFCKRIGFPNGLIRLTLIHCFVDKRISYCIYFSSFILFIWYIHRLLGKCPKWRFSVQRQCEMSVFFCVICLLSFNLSQTTKVHVTIPNAFLNSEPTGLKVLPDALILQRSSAIIKFKSFVFQIEETKSTVLLTIWKKIRSVTEGRTAAHNWLYSLRLNSS